MKLYLHNYWRSSASQRVRIGLNLKGLAYDYVSVDITQQHQFAEAYRARNPMAQVPTFIVDDGATSIQLTQSLPILEYVNERWPDPPILPVDLFLRARCRALAEIINSGIQPMQNLTTTKTVKAFGGDEVAWPKAFITAGLEAYERAAKDVAGQFSVGDAPTIADCCLIPQLASARRFGVDISQRTLLLAIEERCLRMPAFVNAAPDRQTDARPS